MQLRLRAILLVTLCLYGCAGGEEDRNAASPAASAEPSYVLKAPMRLYSTCTNISQNLVDYGATSMHSQLLPVGTRVTAQEYGWSQVAEDETSTTYSRTNDVVRVVTGGGDSGCVSMFGDNGGSDPTNHIGDKDFWTYAGRLLPFDENNPETKVVPK